MRQVRYRGLDKTRLEHAIAATALNPVRPHAWWNGHPSTGPAPPTWPASSSPWPHEPELTSRVSAVAKTRPLRADDGWLRAVTVIAEHDDD